MGKRPWPWRPPTRSNGYLIAGTGIFVALMTVGTLVSLGVSALPLVSLLTEMPEHQQDPAVSAVTDMALWMIVGVSASALVLLGGMSAGLVWWGLWLLRRAQRLEQEGRLTTGIVTDRWSIRLGRGCVAYTFTPEGMGERSAVVAAEYNWQAYTYLSVGERIQVRYVPEDPRICRIEGAWR